MEINNLLQLLPENLTQNLAQMTDSFLKITLGALVASGVAWYLHWRATPNKADLRESRRIQIMEEVSRQVGRVSHLFAKYSSLAVESIQVGDRWPQLRRQEFETINTELVTEFQKLADMEAKLLMLGEKNLERGLRLYGNKIAVFRKQVYVCRKDITAEQIHALKTNVAQVREQFYDMLSRKYDMLLTSA